MRSRSPTADIDATRGTSARRTVSPNQAVAPWHFLNFLPEPHGHGSLRPTLAHLFDAAGFGAAGSPGPLVWSPLKSESLSVASASDFARPAPTTIACPRTGAAAGGSSPSPFSDSSSGTSSRMPSAL